MYKVVSVWRNHFFSLYEGNKYSQVYTINKRAECIPGTLGFFGCITLDGLEKEIGSHRRYRGFAILFCEAEGIRTALGMAVACLTGDRMLDVFYSGGVVPKKRIHNPAAVVCQVITPRGVLDQW